MVQWLSTTMNKSMTCYQIDKKMKYSVRSTGSTEGMHTSYIHVLLVLRTTNTVCSCKQVKIVDLFFFKYYHWRCIKNIIYI